MAQAGGFKTTLDNFKKSKQAIPLALVLTGVICYFLLIFGSVLFCLLPAVIALNHLRIAALLWPGKPQEGPDLGNDLILFLGIASGLTYYTILTAEAPVTLNTTDNVLTGGSITPFRGTDSTDFTFSVIYTGTNSTPHVFVTVYDYFRASQGTRYNLTNDSSYAGTGASLHSAKDIPDQRLRVWVLL